MRRLPKYLIPTLLGGIVLGSLGIYFLPSLFKGNNTLTVSGTIEATEIRVGTQLGGRIDNVSVDEGANIKKGDLLAMVHPASSTSASNVEQVRAPIDGVVLDRLVQPGEIVAAGSTLLNVANLASLTLTVYIPEDRYGQFSLGQTYPISVDSFPGVVFTGVVTHIADQAEFTPRNVQTVEGRKATVYAVRLTINNPNRALKPGMPAELTFGK
jgi:multidrug efflux pump subunit AcrA (membrane-fusion protein)